MSTSLLAEAPGLRFKALAGALPLGGIFGGLTLVACVAVGLLGLDRLSFTPCFFKLATGLPCPTCGTTRAFGRLAHLDLAGALTMNPLATLGALGLVVWATADAVLLPRRRALRLHVPGAWHTPIRILVLAALLLNWAFLLVVRR